MRVLLAVIFTAAVCAAQSYTQRGFLESRATFYPQTAANDRARMVGESLFRYEGFLRPSSAFQLAGSVDLRLDTHHQVERDLRLSWQDRETRRPTVEVRRLSGMYHKGPMTFEAGKQFVRWGKTDIVTPTDRFAPRDFLTVVDNDFLPITAARLTFEKGSNTVDAVWSPRLTPSRIPLPDQRWVVLPDLPAGVRLNDAGAKFPGGPQSGARWNHAGTIEYGVALYQGFNHMPSFEISPRFIVPFLTVGSAGPSTGGTPSFNSSRSALPTPAFLTARSAGPSTVPDIQVDVQRFYPRMFMVGGDVAFPLPWLTVKGEAARFTSSDHRADEFGLYVLQLERQTREWFFVGGYAAEIITREGTQAADFVPDRGLSQAFLGRAGYTIDANRSIAIEAAARQNGKGTWTKFEYSQAMGQHWRTTLNLTLIRGEVDDFLGQYRRNSHALLVVRYSY